MVVIKNKEYLAEDLIISRKQTIDKIKKYWIDIQNFNIVDKTYTPKVNVQKLYDEIKELEVQLVDLKLANQGINMRMKTMSEMKESAYPSIYTLSQLKERKEKLRILKATIDKQSKDVSKTSNIVLTSDKIDNEISEIDKEIKLINEDLETFNKIAKFTM